MNKYKNILCLDLDDTLYRQSSFDNQIIDFATNSLCKSDQRLIEHKQMLLLRLKSGREKNRSSRSLFHDIFSELDIPRSSANQFIKLYKHYALNGAVKIKPVPQAARFIAMHKSTFTTFLITNGPYDQQARKIDLLGISNLFDQVLILDGKNDRKTKPDPSYFLKTLDQLRIIPNLDVSVMIGDSCCDKLFANSIGISYYHPVYDLCWSLDD